MHTTALANSSSLASEWTHRSLTYDAMQVISDQSCGIMGRHLYSDSGAARYESLLHGTQYSEYAAQETRLIQEHAPEIARRVALYERVIIVGAGTRDSFQNKEQCILNAALRMPHCKIQEVSVVDLSNIFADSGYQQLTKSQNIRPFSIKKHVTDFRDPLLISNSNPAAVIAVGGINIELDRAPDTHFPARQLAEHLRSFARLSGIGGLFVMGYDTCRDKDQLEAIYNGHKNLAFIQDPLVRLGISNEFTSAARYIPSSSCVASYWIANRTGFLSLPTPRPHRNAECYSVEIHKGEHTIPQISIKPDPAELPDILKHAGFQLDNTYSNRHGNHYRILQAMICDRI